MTQALRGGHCSAAAAAAVAGRPMIAWRCSWTHGASRTLLRRPIDRNTHTRGNEILTVRRMRVNASTSAVKRRLTRFSPSTRLSKEYMHKTQIRYCSTGNGTQLAQTRRRRVRACWCLQNRTTEDQSSISETDRERVTHAGHAATLATNAVPLIVRGHTRLCCC